MSLIVHKPWGHEEIHTFDSYVMKKLFINKGHKLSLQYHNVKHETLILFSGSVTLWWSPNEKKSYHNITGISMVPGKLYVIEPGTVHRMNAEEDSIILECSTTELDDVVRLQDDYGRAYSEFD